MKFVQEIVMPMQDLSYKGFPGGHIAVRLQIPAAHDVPFPLGDQLPYPVKKFRVVLFYIFVEKRFVVIENKTLVRITKIGGCSERG